MPCFLAHASGFHRFSRPLLSFAITLALSGSAPVPALADPFEFTFTELAPGVWTGYREDSLRLPIVGNTTFVVTDQGVIVFDGGGVPLMTERLLEKIDSVTDQPITHVGISHWHGDHHFGIWAILDRYPDAEVIAHSFTRAAMTGSPIAYVDRLPTFVERNTEFFQTAIDTGFDLEGRVVDPCLQERYADLMEDIDLIGHEYGRARVIVPTITFDDRLVLHRGDRTIEFLFLGAGNTGGDMLMWLPEDRIVAAGDLVVHPTPYLFNVPPRIWSETMRRLNALEYDILVPGHGTVQRDTQYVDLLIETSDSIADQRDTLLAEGLTDKEVVQRLDFSAVEPRYTDGDDYLTNRFRAWGSRPFRRAAIKALTGEPMVVIGPRYAEETKEEDRDE